MDKNLIVNTCGTSLLTNDPGQRDGALQQLLRRHTNDAEAAIPAGERAGLAAHIDRRRVLNVPAQSRIDQGGAAQAG